MAFRVGMKVVCINAESFNPYMYPDTGLVLNAVYTVAMVRDWFGINAIELCELRSPHESGLFHAGHFRPLTDISVFTRMLTDKVVEVNNA